MEKCIEGLFIYFHKIKHQEYRFIYIYVRAWDNSKNLTAPVKVTTNIVKIVLKVLVQFCDILESTGLDKTCWPREYNVVATNVKIMRFNNCSWDDKVKFKSQ